jgi:arsenate reductase
MPEPARVLFVCVGNACRSQMAEGFAKAHGGGKVEVRSAGTSAAGFISSDSVSAMKERGIDITSQTSDQLTDEMVEWADVVVTLGCCTAREICPVSYEGGKGPWRTPSEDPWRR